jgi:uncharacterized protein with GYD domain
MPIFMLSMNFTDQGIRGIKDAPKRAQAARDLGEKVGALAPPAHGQQMNT